MLPAVGGGGNSLMVGGVSFSPHGAQQPGLKIAALLYFAFMIALPSANFSVLFNLWILNNRMRRLLRF